MNTNEIESEINSSFLGQSQSKLFLSHPVTNAPCNLNLCPHISSRDVKGSLGEINKIKDALNQSAILAIADHRGIIQYVNDNFCNISKYSQGELIGKPYKLLNSGYHSQDFFNELWLHITVGKVWQGDIKDRAKDGSFYWVNTTIVPFLDDAGDLFQYLAIQFDITPRKNLEESLIITENQYHTLVNLSPVGIFRADAKGNFLEVNDRWCAMTGLDEMEALGNGWVNAIHPDDLYEVTTQWYQAIEAEVPFKSAEYRLAKADRALMWVYAQAVAERGAGGEVLGYVGTITDITERKLAEEQLQYYAWHDTLTGLPNRALFLQRLETAIKVAKARPDSIFAVLFLDLNRFKVINDSLGHLVGDKLLSEVAKRLSGCIRSRDTIARLGGDEFTILLQGIRDVPDVIHFAQRINSKLSEPFYLEGHEIFTSASIGIVLSGSKASETESRLFHPVIEHDSPADVLRDADTAMYQAKNQGAIPGYAIFDSRMYDEAVDLLQLESDLKRATKSCGEFVLHYQPIVDLKSNKISGFEALVRWVHPTKGLVYPNDFIGVAEETGSILALGRCVLSQAIYQLKVWQDKYQSDIPLTMSINLSAKQFVHSGLVRQIDQILLENEVDGSHVNLEITEGALMDHSPVVHDILKELRARSINLSIDDFGTGYSSLSNLACFPLNTLKIDPSFISQLGANGENSEIVWTIITLAHNLGLDVVAEGVEEEFQVEQLRKLNCDKFQGILVSYPLEPNDIELLLSKQYQG